MGSSDWCKKCGAFVFDCEKDAHICPPLHFVVCDEYDPDHEFKAYARDYEAAVEKWAEWYDEEDGPTIAEGMGDVEMVVRVKLWNEHTWKTYKVSGEFQAHYSATPVN